MLPTAAGCRKRLSLCKLYTASVFCLVLCVDPLTLPYYTSFMLLRLMCLLQPTMYLGDPGEAPLQGILTPLDEVTFWAEQASAPGAAPGAGNAVAQVRTHQLLHDLWGSGCAQHSPAGSCRATVSTRQQGFKESLLPACNSMFKQFKEAH
jgi:hypothetical protein